MIPKAFFFKEMGAFCRKSGESQKRECPSPYHCPPAPRHFERSEKSSLHNSQAEKRQMRSSRSTHAILSLPHKYRVPQGRKRSLGYARDDDTRERAISHSLSFLHVEGCPCGAVYPPPSARPFFKGLHKNHVKKRNAQALLTSRWESQRIENTASPVLSFRAKREIFFVRGKAKDVGQRKAGNTVLPANRKNGVSCKLIHA